MNQVYHNDTKQLEKDFIYLSHQANDTKKSRNLEETQQEFLVTQRLVTATQTARGIQIKSQKQSQQEMLVQLFAMWASKERSPKSNAHPNETLQMLLTLLGQHVLSIPL